MATRWSALGTAGAIGLGLSFAVSVWGAESATATISSTPLAGSFDYAISLHNTGTTDIGTYWFGWTPPGRPIEYDFLPSAPSSTTQPAGWIAPIVSGFPGYSIEFYNYTGSPIAAGQTGTFHFTSSLTPQQLQGTSLGFPITTSVIYAGLPESDAGAFVSPVFVPEPAGVALATAGMMMLAGMKALRRARTAWIGVLAGLG